MLRGTELAIAEEWQQQSIQENKQPPLTTLQTALIIASRQKVDAEEAKAQQRVIIMRRQLKAIVVASVAAIGGLGVFGFTGWWTFERSEEDVKNIVKDWNREISHYIERSLQNDFREIASFSDSVASDAKSGKL
ncbi:MAG: hypothetical protein F6K09_29390, partial [Merismopedia sp. SIO2A8]|nr:hypothetical protein [Merismopedia sp. SIO2A8]